MSGSSVTDQSLPVIRFDDVGVYNGTQVNVRVAFIDLDGDTGGPLATRPNPSALNHTRLAEDACTGQLGSIYLFSGWKATVTFFLEDTAGNPLTLPHFFFTFLDIDTHHESVTVAGHTFHVLADQTVLSVAQGANETEVFTANVVQGRKSPLDTSEMSEAQRQHAVALAFSNTSSFTVILGDPPPPPDICMDYCADRTCEKCETFTPPSAPTTTGTSGTPTATPTATSNCYQAPCTANGQCNDGGPGSVQPTLNATPCGYGMDCTDCGPRSVDLRDAVAGLVRLFQFQGSTNLDKPLCESPPTPPESPPSPPQPSSPVLTYCQKIKLAGLDDPSCYVDKPLNCTLDFVSTSFADASDPDRFSFVPDGSLMTEFTVIERIYDAIERTQANEPFWCGRFHPTCRLSRSLSTLGPVDSGRVVTIRGRLPEPSPPRATRIVVWCSPHSRWLSPHLLTTPNVVDPPYPGWSLFLLTPELLSSQVPARTQELLHPGAAPHSRPTLGVDGR